MHTSYLTGSNASYYYNLILNGTSNNNFVFEFSVDDDIIEFLSTENYPVNKTVYNGNNPVVARLCGESSRPSNKAMRAWEFKTPSGGTVYFQAKVVNQKAGIYFALFGKMQDWTKVGGNPSLAITDIYAWRFKPMCWAERVQPLTYYFPAPEKRYAWQSTRSLSKYDIGFQWELYEYNTYIGITTPVLQIKAGY